MKAAGIRSSLVLCAFLCTAAPAGAQTPPGALAVDERSQPSRRARATGYLDGASVAARPSSMTLQTSRERPDTIDAAPAAVPGQQTAPSGQAASPASAGPTEALFWQSIVNSEDPADFEAYLEQFPNGVFRRLAENRLSTLRSSAPTPASAELEGVFWQSIAGSAIPADFAAYLAQFPNGAFRRLAENRLSALRSPPGAPAGASGRLSGVAGSPVSGSLVSGPRVSGASGLAVETAAARLRPGDVFRDCEACPEMMVIPAGRFRMGCVSGLDCADSQLPVHEVEVGSFAIGRYETTFDEYERFVAATGRRQPDDRGMGRGRRPVIEVSWEDATAYVAWLSEETGARYRLPNEAEWEYAARAGTETRYSWGQDVGPNRANCARCDTSWPGTAPVGSFGANPWRLHDMHGNVWEWVEDCWHDNYSRAPRDGTAWTAGGNCSRRVRRGGAWGAHPAFVSSASRWRRDADDGHREGGFRVAMTLD